MKKRIFAVLMALCMMFSMTTVALADEPLGTESNPKTITTLGGEVNQVDGQEGYWYSYTAPSKGYVEVTSVEGTAEEATAGVKVINTRTGAEATGGDRAYANKDDVLLIQVFSRYYDFDLWENVYVPATITWSASYVEAGTASKPAELEMEYYGYHQKLTETTINEGEDYYYAYKADVTGLFTLYVEYSSNPNVEIIITREDGKSDVYSTSEKIYTVTSRWGVEEYKAIDMNLKKNEVVKIHISCPANDDGQVEEVLVAWNANIIAPYASEGNPVPVYDMPSESFQIPAGQRYYFAADSMFQKTTLIVDGENIDVYNVAGEKATIGTDGLTDVKLVLDKDTYTCIFSVENKGEETAEVAFDVEYPIGSLQVPAEIEDTATQSFEADDDMGYYYTWTAPATGIVSVNVSSTSETWLLVVENLTEYAYDYANYEEPKDVRIVVDKDDEVLIWVNAAGEAADVTTNVVFSEAVGVLDAEVYEGTVTEIYMAIEDDMPMDDAVVYLDMCDDNGDVIASIVPTEILMAAQDYKATFGEDLPIIIGMDTYEWYIENITDVKPVDLAVKFDTANIPEKLANKVLGELAGTQISLSDCDDFGFDATLVLTVEDEYEGKHFSLFYYNEDGNLECVGNDVVSGGMLAFAFEHASDYLMVADDVEVGTIIKPDVETPPTTGETPTTPAPETPATPTPEVPKTGDNTNFALWIAVLGLGVVAMATSVVMKKREF